MLFLAIFVAVVYGISYPLQTECTNCCNHWTYEEQATWGSIQCNTSSKSGVALTNQCQTGQFQSPVNISTWKIDRTLPRLTLVDYGPNTNMTIVNNGHTIQATYTNGYYNNDREGTFYQIGQFHFHTHSEESVKGLGDVASMHLVHTQNPAPSSTTMGLSVLGVLFVVGADNPLLDPIIAALSVIPLPGTSTTISFPGFQTSFEAMNAAGTNDYWNYPGSLTTPPCLEKIDWTLLSHPWTISQNQLNALNAVLVADVADPDNTTSNYRQIQRTLFNVPYFPGTSSSAVLSAPFILLVVFLLFQ